MKKPFEPVSNQVHFPDLEQSILEFWKSARIFEKSVEQRDKKNAYVFYDGPPFATGLPHYGHLLAGTIKDIVPRYWAMQGKRVERRFGWDCHGLPVENEAAKDLKETQNLDLSGKYEIEAFGVDRYNEYCRSIVLKYTEEWEQVVTRMGRWVDFENGYRTMDRDFMESIWWVFKQLWDKGLVYEGHMVMPFSWKLSTPLSNFEANMNYQDVQDPAVTVKFELETQPNTFILAWTTTPWTLPSNLGLAVGQDLDYVAVKGGAGEETWILAEPRISHFEKLLKTELKVVTRYKGRELLGLRYRPVFPYFRELAEQGAFVVIPSGHVTTEDGTGVVHMAPAFGEDDFWACKEAGLPFVDPVDMEGRFTDPVSDVKGQNIKEADKALVRLLKEGGSLVHQGTLQHSYPFCWRSNTPLIYKAIRSWFVNVEAIKDRLIANNNQISWVPDFVGSKRFGNWLENARDWNISRNRFWGTPIPLWQCEETQEFLSIGSVAELEKLTGTTISDLHCHYIDQLEIQVDGKTYRRVPLVFDCWFESGSMPYAQNHYPFENREFFEENFPADFIAEGLDQTRGWFYTLMVLSTALFDKPAFKNVVVNGLILAEDGQKMSKQKKNYPDPMLIIDRYGADCLRSYLINSPVVRAEPLRFREDGIVQIYRNLVSPLWNAYAFFVTYANLDAFEPNPDAQPSNHELDRWIVSQLQSLVADVTRHMTHNHLYAVVPELQKFVDSLTNWYIRRSRRRFWRAENDSEKTVAFQTLYDVLIEFSKVMAPFLPFVCEAIYRNLAQGSGGRESVHLCDYPKAKEHLIDLQVEQEMGLIRQIVEMGRSLRSAHNLKIRLPLAEISVVVPDEQATGVERLSEIVCEELNVKSLVILADETELVAYAARPNLKVLGPRLGQVMKVLNPAIRELSHRQVQSFLTTGTLEVEGHSLIEGDLLIDRKERPDRVVTTEAGITLALDTHLTDALLLEGDARELVNRIQNLRKEAGFEVQDRIHLRIDSDWAQECLLSHGETIMQETLAVSMNDQAFNPEIVRDWEVNGKNLTISLARA